MKIDLAILIPTLTNDRRRVLSLRKLVAALDDQRAGKDVIILINPDDRQKTTGQKRNELVAKAMELEAKYISFVDDDDMISGTYVQRGVEVAESGLDCGELWGNYYERGRLIKPFHHYLGCTHAWDDKDKYHRPPNHLNFMRLDLVKDFMFQDKTIGEDMTWAMEIQNSGAFKTMYKIPEVIYHYYK